MKKLLLMCLALAAFGMVSMSSGEALTMVDGGPEEYIYIKLKNDCDQDVRYEYKYSGGGASGSLSAHYERKISLQVGAQLFVDGVFLREITKDDDKQVIIACE